MNAARMQMWKRKQQYKEEKRQQKIVLAVRARLAGMDRAGITALLSGQRSVWVVRQEVERLENLAAITN